MLCDRDRGCASVGEGFFFAKTGSPVATLRIKTGQANVLKLHKQFPVVIHIGG